MLVEHALWSCVPSVFGFCLVWGRLEKVRRAIEQRDPATGLRSGHLFDDHAAVLGRAPGHLAVFVVEIDNRWDFSPDLAVATAAEALKVQHKRSSDRLYRVGARSFASFGLFSSKRHAYLRAESMRAALSVAGLEPFIGVATADESPQDRDPARLRRLAECFRDDAKTQRSRIFPPWDDGPKPPTVSSASPLVTIEAAP